MTPERVYHLALQQGDVSKRIASSYDEGTVRHTALALVAEHRCRPGVIRQVHPNPAADHQLQILQYWVNRQREIAVFLYEQVPKSTAHQEPA